MQVYFVLFFSIYKLNEYTVDDKSCFFKLVIKGFATMYLYPWFDKHSHFRNLFITQILLYLQI